MPAPRLISKAEFSKEAGVSRAAVTKACANVLRPAISGKKIDIDHPAAVEYITSKRAAPTVKQAPAPKPKRPPKQKAAPPPPPQEPHYSKENDLKRVMHLTLAELVKEFGTDSVFKEWVSAHKTIADINFKNLKIAEAEDKLIPRDIVKTHIFGAMEATNQRLLHDVPKKLARLIYASAKAGASLEEGEKKIRDEISKQLRNSKATATRLLG